MKMVFSWLLMVLMAAIFLNCSDSTTTSTPTNPLIAVSVANLAFGNEIHGSSSAEQSFTVSGENLTNSIIVKSPNGFVVSLSSDNGFSDSVVINLTKGTITTTSVFVKFKPTAVQAYTGNITIISEGTSKSVSVNGTGIQFPVDMVLVTGGLFEMGLDQDAHQVSLNSFLIGKCEVTQSEWLEIMGTNPSYFPGDLNRPVENISWYDILVYCNNRSINENLTPCYSINGSTDPVVWGAIPTNSNPIWNAVLCNWSANGYRMLTEAEWEFAARGGNVSQGYTYSGSNSLDDVAWYSSNSGSATTHPVGTKSPNEIGIYDMSGNVKEWTWDWYSSYNTSAQTNPTGPSTGALKVYRGGYYYSNELDCRVFKRRYNDPYDSDGAVGVRIARKF